MRFLKNRQNYQKASCTYEQDHLRGTDMKQQEVGTKIRSLRLGRNMKQSELGAALSVASSTISNWENGRRLPSINELKRVAAYFDTTLDAFYVDTDVNRKVVSGDEKHVFNQTIDFRPAGFHSSKVEYYMLMGGAFSLVLVSITRFIFQYVFLFIGFLSLLGTVLIYLDKRRKISLNNYKRIVIPAFYKVYYVHKDEVETVDKKQNMIHVFAVTSLIASVVAYGLSIGILLQYDRPLLNVFISIFALTAIVIHFFSYRNIQMKRIPNRLIPYYGTMADLRYPIIFWSFLVDGVGMTASAILSLLILYQDAWQMFFLGIAFSVSLIASYAVVRYLNGFIADLRLRFGEDEKKLENLGDDVL